MSGSNMASAKPPLDVLLIGFGASGQRFYRVFSHIAQTPSPMLRVTTIVDRKVDVDFPSDCRVCTTLTEALAAQPYDVAVVCVNEHEHFAVLSQLAQSPIPTLLCEKPLTATLDESRAVLPQLAGKQFALNMVERYSPVVADFHCWARTMPGLMLRRAQFFWGKHRVRDVRPTMGVLSEIIHPLDLVAHIFNLSSWRVLEGFVLTSDFTHDGNPQADTVHCKLLADARCVVSAHASFAWAGRRREVTGFLTDDDGASYQAHFTFDEGLWDCDTLTIHRICTRTGDRKEALSRRYTVDDFPASLHQVHKVYQFVRAGLEPEAKGRVDLADAFSLQELLDDIADRLTGGANHHERLFSDLVQS